jgi:hypothetical protein
LGKVFSVSNRKREEGESSSSNEDDEDEDDEIMNDDYILGQILNHYQTRHSIINEGPTSANRELDAEFFKYE